MRDRVLLACYLAAVVAASLVHDPRVLAAALLLVLAGAGRRLPRVLLRLSWSVVPVLVLVSVGWWVADLLAERPTQAPLAAFVLRVLLITGLTLSVLPRIDPFRALAFSRGLTLLLVLGVSQALTLARLWQEMRWALRCRTAGRPRLRDGLRHAAAAAGMFVHKGLGQAGETALAMRARGWLDDRG